MKWRTLFVSLIPMVENFINDKSKLYKIDPSHNLHHSLQVKELGFIIAGKDYYLNTKQKEILYLSCMLHDMCDEKYAPRAESVLDISNFLIKKCGVSMMTHDAVMHIITSMSYSKIVREDGTIEFPSWLQMDPDGWVDVFHITREADLLTSYDIKRMIHYKCEKLGFVYPCDVYEDVVNTVGKRMSKLLQRNLFISPSAKKIATKWHDELSYKIENLSENDIYEILSSPLETPEDFHKRVLQVFEL